MVKWNKLKGRMFERGITQARPREALRAGRELRLHPHQRAQAVDN